MATVVIQNFFLSAPYGRNWNCKCCGCFMWQSYIDIAISLVELSARPNLAGADISRLFLWLCLGPHSL
jgi:hypothetical protein